MKTTEMEQLKLDLVKEMKGMREDFKNALDTSQECIKELQKTQSKMNTKPAEKPDSEKANGLGIGGLPKS